MTLTAGPNTYLRLLYNFNKAKVFIVKCSHELSLLYQKFSFCHTQNCKKNHGFAITLVFQKLNLYCQNSNSEIMLKLSVADQYAQRHN